MLTYDELKESPRKFVSLTSLTPDEFDLLVPAFERACLKKYPVSKIKTGSIRKRKTGAGRKGSLASIEEKLLFALVYQKSYPLQSVMGELFGMGQDGTVPSQRVDSRPSAHSETSVGRSWVCARTGSKEIQEERARSKRCA